MKKAKVFTRIVLVMGLVVVGLFFFLTRGLNEGKNVSIEEVDIASLEDGIYIGEYSAGRWTNRVEVRVEERRIVNLFLMDGFRRENVMEEVYNRIMQDQTLIVDVVSGATVSSKAYIKAIENALRSQ